MLRMEGGAVGEWVEEQRREWTAVSRTNGFNTHAVHVPVQAQRLQYR